jgi:hypothetical protein
LEGFAAALLLAAAGPFARWGNESSSEGGVRCVATDVARRPRFALGAGDEFRSAPLLQQRNSPHPVRVPDIMLTGAVVFGMVGVAVGFTWEYVFNRER